MEVQERKKTKYVGDMVSEQQYRLAGALVEGKHQGKTRTELLKEVGYATISAESRAKDIFTSQGVQKALISLGVTPEKILQPAIDALQANQTTAYQGEIYQSDVPDLTLRMKGADQIAEILGLKKQVIEQRTVNVNVEFEDINHLFGG